MVPSPLADPAGALAAAMAELTDPAGALADAAAELAAVDPRFMRLARRAAERVAAAGRLSRGNLRRQFGPEVRGLVDGAVLYGLSRGWLAVDGIYLVPGATPLVIEVQP